MEPQKTGRECCGYGKRRIGFLAKFVHIVFDNATMGFRKIQDALVFAAEAGTQYIVGKDENMNIMTLNDKISLNSSETIARNQNTCYSKFNAE